MSKKVSQKRVRVLYQNLGGIWYAFADVGNDNIYFGQVPVSASAPKKGKKKTKPSKRAPAKLKNA
jgi:hypothetical protein